MALKQYRDKFLHKNVHRIIFVAKFNTKFLQLSTKFCTKINVLV